MTITTERTIPNNEATLLARLQEGDAAALDTLYRHYWSWLYHYCFNVLRDKPACEDIIQDVFVQLWANRGQLNISVSLKAYLFASCRYALFRAIKTEKVRADLFDDLSDRLHAAAASGRIEQKELTALFQQVIDQLPPKCREVYLLSREENLTYRQIAERLGISMKTVENHMGRALQDIKKALPGLLTLELFALLDRL